MTTKTNVKFIYAEIVEEKQMPSRTPVVCLPISPQYREFKDSLFKNYTLSPTELKSPVIIPAKYQNYEPHKPISIDEYQELYGEVVVMTVGKDPILLERAAAAAAEILRLKCEVEKHDRQLNTWEKEKMELKDLFMQMKNDHEKAILSMQKSIISLEQKHETFQNILRMAQYVTMFREYIVEGVGIRLDTTFTSWDIMMQGLETRFGHDVIELVVEEDLHFPLQYWAALKHMSSSLITCKQDSYDFDKDLTLAREAQLHGEYADLNEPFMELINWLMKRQKYLMENEAVGK